VSADVCRRAFPRSVEFINIFKTFCCLSIAHSLCMPIRYTVTF
jgi:hypothetical protein